MNKRGRLLEVTANKDTSCRILSCMLTQHRKSVPATWWTTVVSGQFTYADWPDDSTKSRYCTYQRQSPGIKGLMSEPCDQGLRTECWRNLVDRELAIVTACCYSYVLYLHASEWNCCCRLQWIRCVQKWIFCRESR